MKLGVLFSGGKDSFFAMYKAMKFDRIGCLISVIPENKESYMYHTPNIELVDLQAKALRVPIVKIYSKGEKEKELKDLKVAIAVAEDKYNIQGVVTGAVASKYQASRIQKICNELILDCYNPLWHKDQIGLLKEMVDKKFKIIIVGVAGYPLTKDWLGKEITYDTIKKLEQLKKKYDINPAGEGGEIETFVLDSPLHNFKIKIIKKKIQYKDYSGVMKIDKVELVKKKKI